MRLIRKINSRRTFCKVLKILIFAAVSGFFMIFCFCQQNKLGEHLDLNKREEQIMTLTTTVAVIISSSVFENADKEDAWQQRMETVEPALKAKIELMELQMRDRIKAHS